MQTVLGGLLLAAIVYVLVSLVRPLPPFGTRVRTLLIGLPILLVLTVGVGFGLQSVEQARLNQLKETDPAAYQAEIDKKAANTAAREKAAEEKRAAEAAEAAAKADAKRQKELCAEPAMALIMSRNFVRDRLRSPSTADFPFHATKDAVTTLGCGHYRVRANVDSQNGFGAIIRTRYDAVLRHTGDGNWRLESIEMQ